MVVRPAVLVRELYNYLRYGTGWFLGTIVELEVFGSSSLVGESGQVKPVPKERTDLSDPEDIPDIAILAVSSPVTCQSPGLFLTSLNSPPSRTPKLKEQIGHKDSSASMLLCSNRRHAAILFFALSTQWMHRNAS